MDTEEAARILNISIRSIQRWFEAGKIQGEFVDSGKGYGKKGQILKVWISNDDTETRRSGDTEKKEKDHYKVHRGEPGGNVMTDIVNGLPVMEAPPSALLSACTPSGDTTVASGSEEPLARRDGGAPSFQISDCTFQIEKTSNSKLEKIANLRYALIQSFRAECEKNHRPKKKIIRDFLILYNTGVSHPDVFKEIGKIARSTLYEWARADQQAGIFGLAPQFGRAGISKITDHEKNLLLTLLLHQNRLKTAYAITLSKNYLMKQKIESPSSPSTLRRFADQFKKEHYDLWILHREGEKALDDKVLPYIERDRNLLEVGEGLVADGHRLNFQVVNPFTGKPCRAAMVLFWDWRSSYPLGWEIMLEENVQCISTAFRNAVLTLGKMPKWVLMDNGKAFKAKIFTSDINLTETEILGMFARLNTNVHFAWPYNAKAKPIERFFGTFTDQFERLMPSYTGASIEDKPAWTKRNEKLARAVHNPRVPAIEEINGLMHEWREFYAGQPSKGLDGKMPKEIFEPGKGPGMDPGQLAYLMMAREIKNIGRNGVNLFGYWWYDEALYGLRDQVVVKYSLSDLSQLYCFHKNEFLCTLKPREKAHPMASESGTPKDVEDVKRMITEKRGLKKQTVKLYKLLGHKASEQLPWKEIVETVPNVVETIEKAQSEVEVKAKEKRKIITPFLEEPVKKDAVIARRGDAENGRPWFYDDYEKYDWLMAQPALSEKDTEWIDHFRSISSLYKYAEGGER